MIAKTPTPPYYAVIFSSMKSDQTQGYDEMAETMAQLVIQQPGYLGHESARDGIGITVSYWREFGIHQKMEKQFRSPSTHN